MNTTTRTPLVIVFAVVVVLFLLFAAGALSGTMANAGWMGAGWMDGNRMMGNGWRGGVGWMGGMSWMWIPTLLTLGLGIMLGWLAFGKRSAPIKNP